MIWKDFANRWPASILMKLGIPKRTVYDWRSGLKEPQGWQREAAEFWIESKASEPEKKLKRGGK